ncbi:MAG TPA: hypothetical protein PKC58_17280, partial [Ignavibacteria bacterium]|nr:hypothetical protein [Ignavibacteria bacterium]
MITSLFLISGNCMNAQARRDSFLNYLENISEIKLPFTLYFKDFSADADWMYDLLLPYIEKNKNKHSVDYYLVAWALAFKTQRWDLNKRVLNLLIDGAGSTEINTRDHCILNLKRFERVLFGKEEIRKIRNLLRSPPNQSFDLILLCGYLDLKSEKRHIKQHFIGNYRPYDYQSYYKSNEWAAYLALARMGDKNSIAYILQRYRAERDLVDKCKIISKQLDYVKRKETLSQLIEIFTGDLEIPPEYPETKGTPCGQNFIYFLAKSVKNYPYPIKRVY